MCYWCIKEYIKKEDIFVKLNSLVQIWLLCCLKIHFFYETRQFQCMTTNIKFSVHLFASLQLGITLSPFFLSLPSLATVFWSLTWYQIIWPHSSSSSRLTAGNWSTNYKYHEPDLLKLEQCKDSSAANIRQYAFIFYSITCTVRDLIIKNSLCERFNNHASVMN